LNFENDVLLHDEVLTAAIRQRQMEYLAASTPVDPAMVRSWPIWRRIWLNAFATVGPLL
jgi:cardiolipin synthase